MKKIAFLSNVNIELLKQLYKDDYDIYIPSGYNTWIQEIINNNSLLYCCKYDAIFLILDGYELFKNNIENGYCDDNINKEYSVLLDKLCNKIESPIFLSNIDVVNRVIRPLKSKNIELYYENKWNEVLDCLTNNYDNMYIFDLKKIIMNDGRKNVYSKKLWYMGSIPYSLNGLKLIKKEVDLIINSIYGKKNKCLAIDLDNTIWGGVVGEDGINGIKLDSSKQGAIYQDIQKRIKEIKNTGVILVILSKNNISEVYEVFNNNNNMVLKKDDFVKIVCNWNDKAINIQNIAKDLNIGLDSFVFLDDNFVEREKMAIINPSVIVADFPKEIELYEDYVNKLYRDHFYTLKITKEDINKTQMYQQEIKRKNELTKFENIDDYIESLKIKLDIHLLKKDEIERVSQLTQKTNQFNLSTKRYTVIQINEMLYDKDMYVFSIHSKDIYGENGLISVVIIKIINEVAELDTFLMSCRVMGRYIEDAVIDFIEQFLLKKNIKTFKPIYIKSNKNAPIEKLFDRLGYKVLNRNDITVVYSIDLEKIDFSKKKIIVKVNE